MSYSASWTNINGIDWGKALDYRVLMNNHLQSLLHFWVLYIWFAIATMWQMHEVDHINTEFIYTICCHINIFLLQHSTLFFLDMFCYFFFSFFVSSHPTDICTIQDIKEGGFQWQGGGWQGQVGRGIRIIKSHNSWAQKTVYKGEPWGKKVYGGSMRETWERNWGLTSAPEIAERSRANEDQMYTGWWQSSSQRLSWNYSVHWTDQFSFLFFFRFLGPHLREILQIFGNTFQQQ